jgi:hypothetical protein
VIPGSLVIQVVAEAVWLQNNYYIGFAYSPRWLIMPYQAVRRTGPPEAAYMCRIWAG